MNRRQFLAWTNGAAAGWLDRGLCQSSGPPNILLLLASGWRGLTMPYAGDRSLSAPSQRRLAREGVCFPRAYTTNPASSPARVSLLTGQFPHIHRVLDAGVRMPASAITLAETLAGAGYATGYAGQWDLDGEADPDFVPPEERRQGFEHWTGPEPDQAMEFIRERRSEPFFLTVGLSGPAGAGDPPAEYARLYDGNRFRLRFNVPASGAGRAQRSWTHYYTTCSAIDAGIGRFLEAVEEAGIADETVILFTSDRGEMLGSHGLEGDGFAYEEAVRVPLVVRYPRAIAGGSIEETPVSIADIAPTLLGLAGQEVRSEVQGRDLSVGLSRSQWQGAESIYCQGQLGTPEEWRMVVRGLDKVVVDRDLRIQHLYNLGLDPYEMDNLAEEKTQRRKRDEMSAIVQDWMKRARDRILPSGLRLRD